MIVTLKQGIQKFLANHPDQWFTAAEITAAMPGNTPQAIGGALRSMVRDPRFSILRHERVTMTETKRGKKCDIQYVYSYE